LYSLAEFILRAFDVIALNYSEYNGSVGLAQSWLKPVAVLLRNGR